MAKLFYDEIPTIQAVTDSIAKESFMVQAEDVHLHLLMRKITSDFETILENFFHQWGITTSRFVILNILYHTDDGMTPTQTAKKVGVSNATISAILSALKEANLVQAVQNAGDSRSYKVQLSEAGRELLQKIYPVYHENVGQLWSHFDATEKRQISNLMTRFSQVMTLLGKRK